MLTETLKRSLLIGGICLMVSSPAWAYTLMAPLGGPPWPPEHNWTIHGYGLRGYAGGYIHVVAGSYDYRFHVPFFATVAFAATIVGALAAAGTITRRGLGIFK
jgi:hypothetical protein